MSGDVEVLRRLLLVSYAASAVMFVTGAALIALQRWSAGLYRDLIQMQSVLWKGALEQQAEAHRVHVEALTREWRAVTLDREIEETARRALGEDWRRDLEREDREGK